MDSEIKSLDGEYKQYLQIIRPYLEQLLNQDAIQMCSAWIQRLSNCKENEKNLRNKYVFKLCYQLARGFLEEPFVHLPCNDLKPISEPSLSEILSDEEEYLVLNSKDADTKILFDKKQLASDIDNVSHSIECDCESNKGDFSLSESTENNKIYCNNLLCSRKQLVFGPKADTKCMGYYEGNNFVHRTSNIITKLRDIKKQNILLHNELHEMQEKSEDEDYLQNNNLKDNNATANIRFNDSSSTIKSLKSKLKEVQDARNALIDKIQSMQESLDNFNDLKLQEIENIKAEHKMEVINLKSSIKDEIKRFYETRIEDMKHHYEEKISLLEESKIKTTQELRDSNVLIILEKDKVIQEKEAEILVLREQITEKKGLQSFMEKYLDKKEEIPENIRFKTQQLEKSLYKLEKSKTKCVKAYQTKIAYLQRDKHMNECSLQLQLVRQRAQIVNESSDENQAELTAALDKLESKYKDIVANMQATAIQRRIQDQMAVESILKAAYGIQSDTCNTCNFSTASNQRHPESDMLHDYDKEVTSLMCGNKVLRNVVVDANKSFGEDSVTGYCFDGKRLGDLLEKVHVPQRDTGDRVRRK